MPKPSKMARKRPHEASKLPSTSQSKKAAKRQKTAADLARVSSQEPTSPEEATSPPFQQPKLRERAVGQLRTPPPSIPPSVAPTETPYPPHADDAAVRDVFDLHIVHVTPSSKIEAKVRGVLSLLKQDSDVGYDTSKSKKTTSRSTIVALVARSPAANKCISVSEIAKREFLKTAKSKWYQYVGLWVRLEQVKVKPQSHNQLAGPENVDEDEEMEDDDCFEPLSGESRLKVRNVPCLLMYLSTQPVPRFQALYSEQIYVPKPP